MLSAGDEIISEFLQVWHECGRAEFERDCPSLDYDTYATKTAHERRKYIALDYASGAGRSGCYLVDRSDGVVYRIASKYGVPGRRVGTLNGMIAAFKDEGRRRAC